MSRQTKKESPILEVPRATGVGREMLPGGSRGLLGSRFVLVPGNLVCAPNDGQIAWGLMVWDWVWEATSERGPSTSKRVEEELGCIQQVLTVCSVQNIF